ncbi:mitochondrial protein C2orf69 homolog [Glandiceps talaboti]
MASGTNRRYVIPPDVFAKPFPVDNLHRLPRIEGSVWKRNEMIFCTESKSGRNQHVIFFPGDVQDFPELMESNRDNRKWRKWNLEYTANILRQRFPKSYVWVIKSSRQHAGSFSCFDNFVHCDIIGTPTYSEGVEAITHLKKLLENAIDYVNTETPYCSTDHTKLYTEKQSSQCVDESVQNAEDKSAETKVPVELPIVLVGFSKGCVVLNQILHELDNAKRDSEVVEFLGRWKDLYWLDGGHSGELETWITDTNLLQGLADLKVNIHVHVTPFQVLDPNRPWKGKQERQFVDKLKDMGANVEETLHFEGEGISFKNHFKVIETF